MALALGGTFLAPLTARAASGPFGIDGIVPDPGATPLQDAYGNVKELGPINSNTTKIGVINQASPPMLGYTNPNAQVDLRNAWLTTARDSSTGHVWLYFAWERDSNSGSGFIAYEFMKSGAPTGCAYDTATDAQLIANCNPWANRAVGDFILLWDQSGSSTQISKRVWGGTAPNLTLGPAEALDATVSEARYSSDGFKGEAAVDLTATVFSGTGCTSFANTIPSTVTGNSDTADYKDTILKQAPPISNCGSLTVNKVVVNDNGGTATASDFSFDFGLSGGTTTNYAFEADGSNTFNDLLGTYSATETPISGYTMTSNTCTNVVVGPGDSKSCTITNDDQPGTLIVKKVVVNDNGGTKIATDFSFQVNGGAAVSFLQDGADTLKGLNSLSVNAGSYTVTEPTVAGYDTSYNNCTNVTVTNGGSATCTITNNDTKANPAGTTVQKWVIKDTLNITGYRAGASDAATSVTFRLYSNNTCTTQAGTDQVGTLSGSGTTRTASTPTGIEVTSPGTYYWRVTYAGDSYNNGFTTACGSETTTISAVNG